jgi:hypothetical protein
MYYFDILQRRFFMRFFAPMITSLVHGDLIIFFINFKQICAVFLRLNFKLSFKNNNNNTNPLNKLHLKQKKNYLSIRSRMHERGSPTRTMTTRIATAWHFWQESQLCLKSIKHTWFEQSLIFRLTVYSLKKYTCLISWFK